MPPINSPLVPWIWVPRWHTCSVTTRSEHGQYTIPVGSQLTSRHCHRRGDTALEFQVNYLVIDNIIVALVYTSTVLSRLQCVHDIFDIQCISIDEVTRPLGIKCEWAKNKNDQGVD